jgi:hypothetical protein
MSKQLTADLVLRDKYTATITKAARATEATLKAHEQLQRQVDKTAAAFERAKQRELRAQTAASNAQQRAEKMQEAAVKAQARAEQAQGIASAAKPGSAKQLRAAENASKLTDNANKASKAAEKAVLEYERLREKVTQAESVTKSAAEASQKAGDNMRNAAENAEKGWQGFRKEVQIARRQLDEEAAKRREIRIQNRSAIKGIQAVRKVLQPIRNVAVKITAHIANFMAAMAPVLMTLNVLKDGFMWITRKAWTVVLKVKDGVTAVLNKITGTITAMAKGIGIAVATAAAAATAAAIKTITLGATIEDYEVSLRHSIAVNNEDMDPAALDKAAKGYTDWVASYAAETPFSLEEAMAAATSAITTTGGNIDAAKWLTTLGGNIAGLRGKSLTDVMTALSTASYGNFASLKETYGIVIDQAMWKKAGYDLSKVVLKNGNTLWEEFEGGTEKMAETFTGTKESYFGELEGAIAEAGRTLIDVLKPILKELEPLVTNISNGIKLIGDWAAPYIGIAAEALAKLLENVDLEAFAQNLESNVQGVVDWATPIVQPLLDSLETLRGWWGEDGSTTGLPEMFETIKTAAQNTLTQVTELIDTIVSFGTDHSVDISAGIGKVFTDVSEASNGVLGAITAVVDYMDNNWDTISPTLGKLYDDTVGKVLADIESITGDIETAFTKMDTGPDSAFNKFLGSLGDGFSEVYTPIADAIKNITSGMAEDPDTFFDKLTTGVETLAAVYGKLTGWFEKLATAIDTIVTGLDKIKKMSEWFNPKEEPPGKPVNGSWNLWGNAPWWTDPIKTIMGIFGPGKFRLFQTDPTTSGTTQDTYDPTKLSPEMDQWINNWGQAYGITSNSPATGTTSPTTGDASGPPGRGAPVVVTVEKIEVNGVTDPEEAADLIIDKMADRLEEMLETIN